MANTLFIGDNHALFEHRDYLDFCLDTKKKYRCRDVFHVGDFVDNHSINMHTHDPNGFSPYDEYKKTLVCLKRWYKAFPKVKLCRGNHDELNNRQALKNGIPDVFIKTYRQIWEMPKRWDYQAWYMHHETLIIHGKGGGALCPHKNLAIKNMCNIVIGHHHTVAGIEWVATPFRRVFGLSTGCGIDRKKYAFNYQRDNTQKPILGCGVAFDNCETAFFEPMKL